MKSQCSVWPKVSTPQKNVFSSALMNEELQRQNKIYQLQKKSGTKQYQGHSIIVRHGLRLRLTIFLSALKKYMYAYAME